MIHISEIRHGYPPCFYFIHLFYRKNIVFYVVGNIFIDYIIVYYKVNIAHIYIVKFNTCKIIKFHLAAAFNTIVYYLQHRPVAEFFAAFKAYFSILTNTKRSA